MGVKNWVEKIYLESYHRVVKSRFGEEFVVWDTYSTACNAIPPFGLQTIRSDILLAARLSEQRATPAKREG